MGGQGHSSRRERKGLHGGGCGQAGMKNSRGRVQQKKTIEEGATWGQTIKKGRTELKWDIGTGHPEER